MMYYGEAVGFVFAWIAGVAALVASSADDRSQRPAIDQVAAADVSSSAAGERDAVLGVR